jgi:hypothetical protein
VRARARIDKGGSRGAVSPGAHASGSPRRQRRAGVFLSSGGKRGRQFLSCSFGFSPPFCVGPTAQPASSPLRPRRGRAARQVPLPLVETKKGREGERVWQVGLCQVECGYSSQRDTPVVVFGVVACALGRTMCVRDATHVHDVRVCVCEDCELERKFRRFGASAATVGVGVGAVQRRRGRVSIKKFPQVT